MAKGTPGVRVPRRLRRIVELAESKGWTPGGTGDGHFRLLPPAGSGLRPVVFASSPSDHRTNLNCIAQLRRAGVPVPHR